MYVYIGDFVYKFIYMYVCMNSYIQPKQSDSMVLCFFCFPNSSGPDQRRARGRRRCPGACSAYFDHNSASSHGSNIFLRSPIQFPGRGRAAGCAAAGRCATGVGAEKAFSG